MRVLGIDPGTLKMGVGLVDAQGDALSLVDVEVLSPPRSAPLHERLYHLHERLTDLMREWKPSVVAIEEPFVARNVRAAMAVGQAQAVAMVVAASQGLPVFTYSPRGVKQAVTDYGGSSKEQVQEMVKITLGLDELPSSSDAADALAVAICHASASRAQSLVIRE